MATMICKGTYDYSTKKCWEYRTFYVSKFKGAKAVYIKNAKIGDSVLISVTKKASIEEIKELIEFFEHSHNSDKVEKTIKLRSPSEELLMAIREILPQGYKVIKGAMALTKE